MWASVRTILAGRVTDLPANAVDPSDTAALDYAAYFDIAMAYPGGGELSEADKADAAGRLARRLRGAAGNDRYPPVEPAAPRITNLSPEFYSPAEIDRLKRWWDIEPDNSLGLTAATFEEFEAARAWLPFAMRKLRDCAPELHDEIVAIVNEVVIARPDGSQQLDYGAASSFALWGTLAVNAAAHDGWTRYYRTIVHESAHLLLFGLARQEPLVTDAPDRRHASPLRTDPRPMDGIFHAAFVLARECLAFDRLLCRHEETECLLPEDVASLESLLEASVVAFWECDERLRAGAGLSPLGEAVLGECEVFMRANFLLDA